MVDVDPPCWRRVGARLRRLIVVAACRRVRDVYVDGILVVEGGNPLNIDLQAASEALESAQKRSLEKVPDLDWAGRDANELAPMVLETRNEIC